MDRHCPRRDRVNARPVGIVAGLLLTALVSCKSKAQPVLEKPLAFHVAMAPTRIVEQVPAEGASSAASELTLKFEQAAFSERLRSLLDESAFTKVTLVDTPEAESLMSASVPARAREAAWGKEAKARVADPDLLMTSTLVYGPEVEGGLNEKFLFNIPLFLIGGPLGYFANDRDYEAHARLQVEFFDLSSQRSEQSSQWELLDQPIQVDFAGTTMDFLDRADGFGSYATSILIPAGWIAKSNDKVQQHVRDQAATELIDGLLARLAADSRQLEDSQRLSLASVRSREARVKRLADGQVEVRIAVLHRDEEGGASYEILDGENRIGQGRLDGRPDENGQQWIEEAVPLDSGSSTLRVVIEDGRGEARSYTFPVE